MRSIVLIGGFSEIIDLCNHSGYEKIFVVDNKDVGQNTIYLGDDNQINFNDLKTKQFSFCITPDKPLTRTAIFRNIKKYDLKFESLIAKNAFLSDTCKINIGCIIQQGSFVSSNVILGSFVKLNVNACVMHDSIIGAFSTLAPSCTILGRVIIGENCYIGSGATILPSISICNDVIIGAGSVVTKNIYNNGVYAGVPAIKIK